MHEVDVAVVGGGAAGTLLVLQLAKRAPSLRVALIDGSGLFARGVAYSTPDPAHLLNVPAGGMSADPEQPSEFARWLRDRALPFGPDDFAPRRLYGEYLQSLLVEAQRAQGLERLRLLRGEVRAVRPPREGGAQLSFNDGREGSPSARAVVLATGNAKPARARVPDGGLQSGSEAWLPSPWDWERVAAIPRDADVFLLGTGLTAVDVVLTLRRLGHRGRIHALSRHGRLPQPHAEVRAEPVGLEPPPSLEAPSLRALLSRVRAAGEGRDWRAVVDGLRPFTVPLWQALSDDERRRFLRHLRSLWEIHRHRMAPAVAWEVERAREEGQLVIHRGRLERFTRAEGWCAWWRHGGESHRARFEVGVNCTGPAAPGGEDDPLGRALFAEGLVQRDRFGLGLKTEGGALVDAAGRRSSWLFGLGPVLRGERWESTAVPELRVQAQSLAESLAEGLRVRG